jgi:hypothetical protein
VSRARRRRDRERPHGLVHVLEPLLADVTVNQRENFSDLIISSSGEANATGFSNTLQPGGNVHPITEHITASECDVADMDADAKVETTLVEYPGVRVRKLLLDVDRALDGVNGA